MSRNRTHHAKRRYRDAKGRFMKAPRLDAEALAMADAWILRLEDPAATCLTVPYGLPVFASFWGQGAHRPPQE